MLPLKHGPWNQVFLFVKRKSIFVCEKKKASLSKRPYFSGCHIFPSIIIDDHY